MKEIYALIIEDEIPAARLLHSMLTSLRPGWRIETLGGGVEESIEWFRTHEAPDLIFLDIHLTDGSAFDFLSAVKPQSAVIFTTAYDQYAIQAFSVNSIDYILKPIDDERLREAIEKFEHLRSTHWLGTDDYLRTLLDTLKHPERKYRSRFMISSGEAMWSLQVDTIAYFYSEEKVTYAVTAGGKEHVVALPLNKLEEQLNPEQFFRVNRQMILNIDAVECAMPLYKGRIQVKVQPPFKSDIIVSEGRASFFRLWLDY